MQLYRKYRLWRPTAFECDMRFPAAWPCSLLCPTWMRLIPSLLVPHHFSHALKPHWDASDRTFALIKA
ncbi:hypothetical protein N7527_010523 [Penicillium freii]|uniref:Uncharacterized protein n=1 Tax=Penicillium freii TaxID=48697 RepID=A0A101ML01_PENFR|nr:hypothetical protein N7465_010172 [Penicillium sp. CMV-2018d]KAJ5508380.1 hypothetical protein N7527_010523 [Penicillium freii]KUM62505.1 hypothetical protein ACN42_g4568 [Penicillium freii]